MSNNLPVLPTFESWLPRVRAIRTAVAGSTMIGVTGLSILHNMVWVDAVLRGMAATIPMFFAGWAVGLWLCSMLHSAQLNAIRDQYHAVQRERQRQLQEIYSGSLVEDDGGGGARGFVA